VYVEEYLRLSQVGCTVSFNRVEHFKVKQFQGSTVQRGGEEVRFRGEELIVFCQDATVLGLLCSQYWLYFFLSMPCDSKS